MPCHSTNRPQLPPKVNSIQLVYGGAIANKREVSTVKIILPKMRGSDIIAAWISLDSILFTSWLCCWNFLIYVWMLFGLVNNEERTRQTKYHHQMKKNKMKLYTHIKSCVLLLLSCNLPIRKRWKYSKSLEQWN